jgi:hypothetical protein
MSPELPKIDYGEFHTNRNDFVEIYRDAEEPLPHWMPTPRGRSVTTTAFVDASRAANQVTRKSHSGYVYLLIKHLLFRIVRDNKLLRPLPSPLSLALKACLEAIEHLCFMLQCFGIPMPQGAPTHVFCDNESVVKNTTNVESTLNKKHSSIAYHHCHWSVAAGEIILMYISTHENLADCFTKKIAIKCA